jgi:prepilin-type N-terminal cleavage/methylation domain-containing protein
MIGKKDLDPVFGVHGLTLVELIIAMAVFAILSGIAVPRFKEQVQRYRFQSASLELYGIFLFTKSEAIRQGRHVGLSVEGNKVQVFVDGNRNGKRDDADILLRTFALSNAIRILDLADGSNRKVYVFNHRGMTEANDFGGTLVFEGAGGKRKIVVSKPANIRIDSV